MLTCGWSVLDEGKSLLVPSSSLLGL
jgi:hypothetical protein